MKKPQGKTPIELMTKILEDAAAKKLKRLRAGASRQVVTVTGLRLQFNCSPSADGDALAHAVLDEINKSVALHFGSPAIFRPAKLNVTGRFVAD